MAAVVAPSHNASAAVVIVGSRNKKLVADFEARDYVIVDVSSHSKHAQWGRFAPTFPVGGVPVPGMPSFASFSVEGVMQGLKTFKDGTGIDTAAFRAKQAARLSRGKRKYGEMDGYRLGDALVADEVDARRRIFVPTYEHVLDNQLRPELELLAGLVASGKRVALLDNSTNADVADTRKRFTHAALIRDRLMRAVVDAATTAPAPCDGAVPAPTMQPQAQPTAVPPEHVEAAVTAPLSECKQPSPFLELSRVSLPEDRDDDDDQDMTLVEQQPLQLPLLRSLATADFEELDASL